MVDVKRFSSWGRVRSCFLLEKWVYLMPVLLIACLCLAVSNTGTAYTTPSKVPIQGRMTNVSTGVALSGPYNFTFRVYNASIGGTKLWEENQSLVLDSGGLWSTYLGNNTPLDFNFSEDTYIEIEINHDGDPLPRVQLATVPYSKRTDIAANLSCIDCIGGAEINESALIGVDAAQFQGLSSTYFLNISSAYGGDISGTYNSMEVNASKIDTGTLNRSFIEDAYLLNTGDNTSGNYSFDSDTLYVDSSSHRIGIGTSTPTVKLDVQGGVNAADNLTTPLVCLNGDCRSTWPTGSGISSAGGWINTSSETYSSLDVNLSNKFFFNSSSGNVGIGTTGPGTKLQIAIPYAMTDTTYRDALWVTSNEAYASHPLGMYMGLIGGATATTRNGVIGVGDLGATNTGNLLLNPYGGNVGIGTTASVSTLNVAGTTGINWVGSSSTGSSGLTTIGTAGATGGSLWVNTPANGPIYSSGFAVDGSYVDSPSYISTVNLKAYGVKFAGYGSNLAFSVTNGTSLNEAMRIDKSGNVGIGTTGPGARLDVVPATFSSGAVSPIMILESRIADGLAGSGGYIGFRQNDVGNVKVTNDAARIAAIHEVTSADLGDTGLAFYTSPTSGSATERMRINRNGNVGIGTIDPVTKLDIVGTAKGAGNGLLYATATGANDFNYNISNMGFIAGGTVSRATDIAAPHYDVITLTKTGASNQWHGSWENYKSMSIASGDIWHYSGWYKTSNYAGVNLLDTVLMDDSWGVLSEHGNVAMIADGTWHYFEGTMTVASTFSGNVHMLLEWNYSPVAGEVKLAGIKMFKNTAYGSGMAGINTIESQTNSLLINPSGGNVGIGTTSPNVKLQVSGQIYQDSAGTKMIFKSPDGTCSACGPNNSDVWTCASVTCP
jgi:hypothetical protein